VARAHRLPVTPSSSLQLDLGAEYSWTDGVYLHFALFDRPNEPTQAQISFWVQDLTVVHDRLWTEVSRPAIHPPRAGLGGTARYRDPDGNRQPHGAKPTHYPARAGFACDTGDV
jgi:hypothetical protein